VSSTRVPAVSVIVPAYNEEAGIERCLRTLLEGAHPGELDVIVVCNGCTDGTAAVARAIGDPIRVIETPIPSKTRAMNLGDEAAMTYPRVYLDSDVLLSVEALRAVVAPLTGERLEASAPRMRFEVSESPWVVRAFHDVWTALPQVDAGLGGRGVYALSRAGHDRFGAFPDIIGDDLFVDWTVPHDRRTVVDVYSVVQAEPSLRQLIERKARIAAGRLELLERGNRPKSVSGLRTLVDAIQRRPSILPKVPVFVFVTLEARRRGRRRLTAGTSPAWEPLR
jgi:glycosyltransferase involved in cell wall biosynthesis